MRYTIVQTTAEGMVPTELPDRPALQAWCEAKGFVCIGVTKNTVLRPELQGQPMFRGLLGPMWNGDSIRYEDKPSYDALTL